eukprot:m51a1_g9833 hypothetical protein (371) ;mRNA; r:1932572-1933894
MGQCECTPAAVDGHPYVPWIATTFHACVYTPTDILAFVFGMINIVFWIFAQARCCEHPIPQLYTNYKNQDAGALSFTFVLTWLAGDLTNLLGCVLTNQLPTQTYTAVYFCCMDAVLMSQYAYYAIRNRAGKRKRRSLAHASPPPYDDCDVGDATSACDDGAGSVASLPPVADSPAPPAAKSYAVLALVGLGAALSLLSPASRAPGATGRVLMSLLSSSSATSATQGAVCNPAWTPSVAEHVLGSVCAWASGLLYFFGKIPQVVHNWRRGTVEGLSAGMFACCVSANVFYGLQVAVAPSAASPLSSEFWASVFPYILGSLFASVWYFVVLGQFAYYRRRRSYLPISSSSSHDSGHPINVGSAAADTSIPSL